MPTVLINGRVEEAVKRKAESVLKKNGLNASKSIRMLWEYLSEMNDLPPFMKERMEDERKKVLHARWERLMNTAGVVKTAQAVSDEDVAHILLGRAEG